MTTYKPKGDEHVLTVIDNDTNLITMLRSDGKLQTLPQYLAEAKRKPNNGGMNAIVNLPNFGGCTIKNTLLPNKVAGEAKELAIRRNTKKTLKNKKWLK